MPDPSRSQEGPKDNVKEAADVNRALFDYKRGALSVANQFILLEAAAEKSESELTTSVRSTLEKKTNSVEFIQAYFETYKNKNLNSADLWKMKFIYPSNEGYDFIFKKRNSADTSERVLAAFLLTQKEKRSAENLRIILKYGLAKTSKEWIDNFYPIKKWKPESVDQLLRNYLNFNSAQAETARLLLGSIDFEVYSNNPLLKDLFLKGDYAIKEQLSINFFSKRTNHNEYAISFMIKRLVDETQPAAEIIDYFRERKVPLRYVDYAMLVDHFVHTTEDKRFWSAYILKWQSPIPNDLAKKIEAYFPQRSYLETIGSRFKQVRRANECVGFYL